MTPRFVARQLSHPSGFMGSIVMALMNRGNARMNAFAREMLAIGPQDHVLDIGFGGGLSLPALLGKAGRVVGVDRSQSALEAARTRFHDAVAAGRAEFLEGTVEAMPLPDAAIDKALTVNTVYFWSSLPAGMREIRRVIRPGGRLAIGFWPKQWMDRMAMPTDIFTARAPEDVLEALRTAGLREPRLARPKPSTRWCVAVAEA